MMMASGRDRARSNVMGGQSCRWLRNSATGWGVAGKPRRQRKAFLGNSGAEGFFGQDKLSEMSWSGLCFGYCISISNFMGNAEILVLFGENVPVSRRVS